MNVARHWTSLRAASREESDSAGISRLVSEAPADAVASRLNYPPTNLAAGLTHLARTGSSYAVAFSVAAKTLPVPVSTIIVDLDIDVIYEIQTLPAVDHVSA